MLANVEDIPFQTQIYPNLHECWLNEYVSTKNIPQSTFGISGKIGRWKSSIFKLPIISHYQYLPIFQPEQISWWWSPPAWAARWVWSHFGNIPRAAPHPANPAQSDRRSRGPGTVQWAGRADHPGQWPRLAIRIWVSHGQPQVVMFHSYWVKERKCVVYKVPWTETYWDQGAASWQQFKYRTWEA